MPVSAPLLRALLMLVPLVPAYAQTPVCDAQSLGTVACLASKLCACGFERGGAMTGRPAGYRWDCGILRPGCGGDATTPATTGGYGGELPAILGIDRSRTSINNQLGRHNIGPGAIVIGPPPARP